MGGARPGVARVMPVGLHRLVATLALLAGACAGPRTPAQPTPVAVPLAASSPAAVTAPPPHPDAGVATAASAAVSKPPAPPRKFRVPNGDVAWITRLKRDKRFRTSSLAVNGTLHLKWRQSVPHSTRIGPSGEDDTSDRASDIELRIEGDGVVVVPLGAHAGDVWGVAATLCKRAGFRVADGSEWVVPAIDDLVSSVTVEVASGSDDFLVFRAGGALQVLHRQTSDGLCEPMVHEGPLETCRDEPYIRVAEVRLTGATGADVDIEEAIAVGVAGAGTDPGIPFDCAAESSTNVSLLPPP